MTKAELIKRIDRESTGCKLDDVFMAISRALLEGEEKITIPWFGTFSVKTRAARSARNPRTGETVQVPPKKVIVWKTAAGLNARLNGE